MKYTNKQAVNFINTARKQSKYFESVMCHDLDKHGFIYQASGNLADWQIDSNKEVADFLRAMADALESIDEPQQK